MHMKSAETIKYLKETSDRLLDLVGSLATYNAIFLFNNINTEDSTIKHKFIEELDELNKKTGDLNVTMESIKISVKHIEKLNKK